MHRYIEDREREREAKVAPRLYFRVLQTGAICAGRVARAGNQIIVVLQCNRLSVRE